jgi:hypothetical protein
MAAIDQALGYQQQATQNALGMSTDMYNRAGELTQPYIEAGTNALPGLTQSANAPAGNRFFQQASRMDPNISTDYNSMQSDPMYNFVRDKMLESNARRANAGGYTGDIRAGWDRNAEMEAAFGARDRIYGENVDNYNRGYGQNVDLNNMYNQNRDTQYNKLSGLAGMGQNAAINFGNTGANYANTQGNLITGMANAQASGVLGANALQSQQDADSNQFYAGLAGNALGGVLNNWDTISGWF